MITNFWEYTFILRGLEAGLIIAIIAPLIGVFLVLRRYALIADTLSHVSLAGVAFGLLLGINPLITAIAAAGVSAVAMEKLRMKKRVYGDTALSLFLSGSLALALVVLGLAHGFNANLFAYLFGSIVTVKASDLLTMGILGGFVGALVLVFYKELVYISFDEEAATVSGLPVQRLNFLFIILAAVAIAISIPIVGILLVSALMVLPVVAALQLKTRFRATILWAEVISIVSTLSGILISFYLDLSPSGTIVLLMLAFLSIVLFIKHVRGE